VRALLPLPCWWPVFSCRLWDSSSSLPSLQPHCAAKPTPCPQQWTKQYCWLPLLRCSIIALCKWLLMLTMNQSLGRNWDLDSWTCRKSDFSGHLLDP
jgi:hypothetical protein